MNKILFLLLTSFLSINSYANCGDIKENQDFVLFKPKAENTVFHINDKEITIIEFFNYFCPHCYRTQVYIDTLKEKLNKEQIKYNFIKIPAVFSKKWEDSARTFYTFESLNDKKIEDKLFSSFTSGKNIGEDEQKIKEFANNNGLDGEKYKSIYKSFTVDSKTKNAIIYTKNYQIASTPSFIINNKYVVNGNIAQNYQQMADRVEKIVKYLTCTNK